MLTLRETVKPERTTEDTKVDLVIKRTVNDLTPGTTSVIRQILADDIIRQRLMDLGVIEGVEVEMVRSAPFGDPVQIRVMNSLLALRRKEARTLVVDPTGEPPHVGRKRHRRRFGRKSEQR